MPSFLPRTTTHPQPGQLILAHGLTSVNNLIQDELIRPIRYNGQMYAIRSELEAYCATDLEDAFQLEAMIRVDDHAVLDPLQACIQTQAAIDDRLPMLRSSLVCRAVAALDTPPTVHPFARALTWPAIWRDAGYLAMNTAGEIDAISMGKALHKMVASASNDAIDDDAFAAFHRALLSIAAAELDRYFPQIWQPGYGQLEISKGANALKAYLNVAHRLVDALAGHRGTPEGCETPEHVMADYLSIADLCHFE